MEELRYPIQNKAQANPDQRIDQEDRRDDSRGHGRSYGKKKADTYDDGRHEKTDRDAV
jgi:hypothetical protein